MQPLHERLILHRLAAAHGTSLTAGQCNMYNVILDLSKFELLSKRKYAGTSNTAAKYIENIPSSL